MPGFNSNNNNNDEEKDGWSVSDVFESFKRIFGDPGSDKTKSDENQAPAFQFFQPSQFSAPFNQNNPAEAELEDDDDEDDELPAGTFLLFKIPAKQLKPGGLRLFLMFYLMGMQNTPDPNTWRADQRLMSVNDDIDLEANEKTYVLEMLYDIDRTGMLQIELIPSNPQKDQRAEIRIYRCGSRPSTSYLMQESLIVDGVLDELQNISGEKPITVPPGDSDPDEPEIADEDRLLIPDPPNAIEAARESLAFS